MFIHSWLYLRYVVGKQHKTPNNTMKAKPQIRGYTFFARWGSELSQVNTFQHGKNVSTSVKQHCSLALSVLLIHLYSSKKSDDTEFWSTAHTHCRSSTNMKRVHGMASSIGSGHGLKEKGRRSWCAYQTHKIVLYVQ